MFSICSALEIFPASTYAGSPPTQLNRRNTRRMTPSSVGIICHRRRMIYPYTRPPCRRSACGRLAPQPCPQGWGMRAMLPALPRRVDIDVLPLRVENRMLLIPQHPRLDQHVAVAADAEPPRRVGLDDAGHLVVEPVAFGSRGNADALLVELVVLGNGRAGIVALEDILAVEKLHEVVCIGIVGDP